MNNRRRRRIKFRMNNNIGPLRNINKQSNFRKPQCLGSGRTIINIERYIQFQATSGTPTTFEIGTILTQSYEFLQIAGIYRYYKVLGVAVVFEPQQTSVNNSNRTYVFMNWGNGETGNMQYEDSAKVVPEYRVRRITLRYVVPNITCYSDGRSVNPKSWQPANDTSFILSGDITIQTEGNIYVACRAIVKVAFAGNRVRDPSSMIKMYENLKDKYKEVNKPIDGFKLLNENKNIDNNNDEEEEDKEDSEYEGDDKFIEELSNEVENKIGDLKIVQPWNCI